MIAIRLYYGVSCIYVNSTYDFKINTYIDSKILNEVIIVIFTDNLLVFERIQNDSIHISDIVDWKAIDDNYNKEQMIFMKL